jgi:two-component system, cell cycle sensor histidine kinase and response regulator CckA
MNTGSNCSNHTKSYYFASSAAAALLFISWIANPDQISSASLTAIALLTVGGSMIFHRSQKSNAAVDPVPTSLTPAAGELSFESVGTWEFDCGSSEFTWSTETYRIHGWPHDARITLENLKGLIHPEDLEIVKAAARETFETKEFRDLEYRIQLPNNEVRHIHARGRATADSSGRKALAGTVIDVTTKRKKEEESRAFESMLITFIDHLPAVITLKNEKLEHVYGNTTALTLFDVEKEHFAGSTDTAFLPRDMVTRLQAVERSALNTRQPVHTPDFSVGTNGDQRKLRGVCFPLVLPSGEVLVGMYASDVTELESANANSTLLQTALESAANGVVITDVKGRIEWVNPSFTQITGYSAEEAIGNTPRLLKSGVHDPAFYKKMWSTLLKGEVWNGELVNQHKDGTNYYEQMTVTPVRNAAGKIAHYIAVKLDVTDRHELEAKLLRSQRMESIGLLAGGVAHDLNNILAPIMMGVDLLRSTELDPELKREFLNTIAQNCERGAGIIQQVLTFARGVEGERIIIQLRHQVKEISNMGKETFPKDIEIRVDLSKNLWPVLGDPTQLHQILLNFSVNARDAMTNGGHLDYYGENIQLSEPRSFQGFEIPAGRYTRLTVRDTGTGMPPEVLDRVFEPFFTTKEQGKGTGLGLPTVLGIVKSHGGLIEFESTPGKGTSSHVWLPAAESITEGRAKTKSTPPPGHGETILVVDDEESVREMIGAVLKTNNYSILDAEDGASAIAVFASNRNEIDLVLTDIMMPVMDGVALAHALKRIDPNVRIVGSSGFMGEDGDSNRVEALKRTGVTTLLQKPYTPRELLETLAAELRPD